MVSIASYLGQQENQLVSVPAGTYTGADGIFNANPDTSGQYSGYLILVAAGANPSVNTYPVVVDCTTTRMRFQAGSARILFVGFKFQGLVDNQGTDINFWYPDMSWPTSRATIQTWTNPLYNAPRAIHTVGSRRTGIYGANFHDCATAVFCSQKGSGAGSTALHMAGVYIHDLYPSRNDNVWHSDCVADNEGKSQITCTDFTFTPKFGAGTSGTGGSLTGGGVHQECHDGPSTNAWSKGWVAGSANVSFEVTGAPAGPQGVGGHLDCTFDTVATWAWTTPDSSTVTNGLQKTGDYTLHTNAYTTVAPGSPNVGTNDPAALWRAANPYSTYLTYFSFLTPPITVGSRGRSVGPSTGTVHGNGWTTGVLNQAFQTDLPTYGQSFRTDIRQTQLVAAGWTPTNNTGWTNTWGTGDGYDAQVALGVANGCTNFVICPNDVAAVYEVHDINGNPVSNGYPARSHANEMVQFWVNLVNRYKPGGAGGIPSTATVWFEFLNEANQSIKNASNQPDVAEYAYWFDLFVSYARGTYPQIKILLGAPAPSSTNKLAADTWTSKFNSGSDSPNWNGTNWDGTGVRKYAALDWVNLLCNNPSNVLGSNTLKVNGKFDGIAHHTYWSGESPFNTATARGATFPALPSSYRVGYGFSHIRDIKDLYQIAVNAGNTPAKCKVHATECGGVAARYYNAGTTYAQNQMVFQTQGSWNAGTRTWTRATRYISLVNSNTGFTPSSNLGTKWNVSTAAWGGVGGSDVGEPDEVGRYIDEILKVWFGDTTDADGVDISQFTGNFHYYNALDDSADGYPGPGGSSEMFGLRTWDGTSAKGSSGTTSTLYRMQQQAILDDTRTTVVVHANPTCAITSPTASQIIATGGPDLTVTWSYAQADGDAEGSYRVRLLNKTETTTFYDTNWVAGSATSKTIDMIALFGNQFADTSNGAIHARVSVRSVLGVSYQGDSAAVAFDIQWGLPHALIVTPTAGQVIVDPALTLVYTYSDSRGKSVNKARYQVKDKNGATVHDSGFVTPS